SQREDIIIPGFGDVDAPPVPAAVPVDAPPQGQEISAPPEPEQAEPEQAEPEQVTIVDDDADASVIAPAPDMEVFLHHHEAPTKPRRSMNAVLQSLSMRRTMIPILLTLGVVLPAIGIAQWLADPEYPFSAHAMLWSAIALP